MPDNPEHLKIKIGNWIEFSASGRLAIVTGAVLGFCILAAAALL